MVSDLITRAELVAILEQAIEDVWSARKFAEREGISEAYISDVRNGRRDPGQMIAEALGYEPVTMYRRIEP